MVIQKYYALEPRLKDILLRNGFGGRKKEGNRIDPIQEEIVLTSVENYLRRTAPYLQKSRIQGEMRIAILERGLSDSSIPWGYSLDNSKLATRGIIVGDWRDLASEAFDINPRILGSVGGEALYLDKGKVLRAIRKLYRRP